MASHALFRTTLAVILLILLLPALPAYAQQSVQPGTGTTTGTSGTNRTRGQLPPGSNTQPRRPMEKFLFVSGVVVMEDGSAPPPGIAIERVCSSRAKKEAYTDSNGNFIFQIGGESRILPDASEDFVSSSGMPWNSGARGFGMPTGFESDPGIMLTGCEVRAQYPGYFSKPVILVGLQASGPLDIGTIVLHPIAKVPGATVSATSLQAPKKAKKALEQALKALDRKDLPLAGKRLEAAVASFPNYAEAWFELGRLRRRQMQTEEARQAFCKAKEADANFVKPFIELAHLAVEGKRWQEAADLTDRAVAIDPLDFPESFLMNSLANYHLNRMDIAERSVLRAQRLDQSHRFPQTHLLLAYIHHFKRDIVQEVEQLRSYLHFAHGATDTAIVSARLQALENSPEMIAHRQPAAP